MTKYVASVSTHGLLEFESDHSDAENVETDFWEAWDDVMFGGYFQKDGTTLYDIELA